MTFLIQMNDDRRKQNTMYRRWNSTSSTSTLASDGGSSLQDAENPNYVTSEETDSDEDDSNDSNDEIELLLIKTHGSDDCKDEGNEFYKEEGEDNYDHEDDNGTYYDGIGPTDNDPTTKNLKIRRNYNDNHHQREQQLRRQQSSSASSLSSSSNTFMYSIFHRSIFPDTKLTFAYRRNTTIEVLDVNGVKLLKFFIVTILLILLIHYVAQFMVRTKPNKL